LGEKHDKRDPNLTRWAEQGVLLLNSALTCEEKKADKHIEIWRPFIKFLYEDIFTGVNGLIFVYFGKDAAKNKQYEIPFLHYSKIVEHPSFAARVNRDMNHDNLFSWVNRLIKDNNGTEFEIDWLGNNKAPF